MKYIPLYLGIAAAMVASCTPTSIQEEAEFLASFERPAESKEDNILLRWTADERVSLFNKVTYNLPYVFTDKAEGKAVGYRKVDANEAVSGTPISYVVSVYPYQENTQIDESGVISVILPAEQSYAENTFALGSNMMVSVSSGKVLQYKNVGGYLVLNLYGEGVTVSSITLKGNNGEKLAGKASITMPLDGVPSAVMADDASSEITLVCATPVQLGATPETAVPFWFVVPPMTFSKGFTITLETPDGSPYKKSTFDSVPIDRNSLSKVSPTDVEPDYDRIYVPFKDSQFKNYCVSNFDSDLDGEISMVEAENVTKINAGNSTISSLSGIEYFPNLKELDCTFSRLTSLDVSKNTALESLYCNRNQLTSLDLSGQTALKILCCDSNQLTSLNVSGCTVLEYLFCEDNQLTGLDVSGCTALKELECFHNMLTSLNVNGCTALDYLDCNNNYLTNLDVSENKVLTCLHCASNRLISLDLSASPALELLDCSYNQLTDLNVSGCTALGVLYCEDNQLTSLDVSDCSEMGRLWCYNNPHLSEIWLKQGQKIKELKNDKISKVRYK